jgi:hypothetical protein
MQENEDILAAFDIQSSDNNTEINSASILHIEEIQEEFQDQTPMIKNHGVIYKTKQSILFLVKYFTTSACIF